VQGVGRPQEVVKLGDVDGPGVLLGDRGQQLFEPVHLHAEITLFNPLYPLTNLDCSLFN